MSANPEFDCVYTGFNAATMQGARYAPIVDAAIAVRNGRIAWLGTAQDLPASSHAEHIDLGGGWVTPGLIDCHTHLVFGGNRAGEFEQRLQGVSYQQIAEQGGGIAASVAATRAADDVQLLNSARGRLQHLMADGVTTVEIKSGYGLNVESELAMLRAARALGNELAVDVVTTCLAAHAVPPEFAGDKDAYMDLVCQEILPAVAASGLADAVDGFCEGIGFSVAQIERYFATAQSLGLPLKLHAEQLSALGGSRMAAHHRALSADHLEYATQDDVDAMAVAGTVAVLLPGAYYTLKEHQLPPVDAMRSANVPMAVATDCNPGTSPVLSLRLMMNMACTLFGLTPEEALAGATCHAARALGIDSEVGVLGRGKRADFICWDVESPGELSYWMGGNLLRHRVTMGKLSNSIQASNEQ